MSNLMAHEGPTAAQVEYLSDLMGPQQAAEYLSHRHRTKAEVSAQIDSVKAQQDSESVPTSEPGYYMVGNTVYTVVLNKAKTRTYAKVLTIRTSPTGRKIAKWEYMRGGIYKLAGIKPLTLEAAKRIGHLHGICVVCAKQLTVPASVEAGIGPVCASRLANTAHQEVINRKGGIETMNTTNLTVTTDQLGHAFGIQPMVEYHELTGPDREVYDALAERGLSHERCMAIVKQPDDVQPGEECPECQTGGHADCHYPRSTYQTRETGEHIVQRCCCPLNDVETRRLAAADGHPIADDVEVEW